MIGKAITVLIAALGLAANGAGGCSSSTSSTPGSGTDAGSGHSENTDCDKIAARVTTAGCKDAPTAKKDCEEVVARATEKGCTAQSNASTACLVAAPGTCGADGESAEPEPCKAGLADLKACLQRTSGEEDAGTD